MWKITWSVWFRQATAGSLLVWLVVGCGPSLKRTDQQDEKNPHFQKAKRMYQARDYKEAVRYYHEALERDPRNAAAHLELGLLYEDKLQDYAYAIYHYRRYLELRPAAEKAQLVEQFVERCKLALAASVANSPLDTAEEIARLRQENSNLVQQVEYLTQRNLELERRLTKMNTTPSETIAPMIAQTNVVVVPPTVVTQAATLARATVSPSPPPQPQPPPKAQKPLVQPPPRPITKGTALTIRQYVVRKGDTLSSISLKMYGRRDQWQLIYNANRAVVGGPPAYTLRVGQALTIPMK